MIQALDALRRVGEEELSRVVTDEAGAFTLQGRMPASRLPAGLVLRGEKSGWLDAEGPGAALEVTSLPFEKTGLVYRMGRTFLVSGTVIDVVKGEPVRGARIHPESETERLGFLPGADGFFPILPSPDTKTDEGGRFRLDLGPMLAATLVAEAEGFLPGLARADRTHGRGEVQIRLLPVSAASVVRGTVFQGWGSPADGADVKPISLQRSDDSSRVGIHSSREYFDERTSRSGVRCAPDGTFSIPLPSGGSWKLTAEWEGAEGSATLSVAPGEVATCRIDLDSFRIAGWVVDETSGEPISGALVRSEPAAAPGKGPSGPTTRRSNPTARTDETGSFLLDLGGAQTATLLVEADGYLPGSAEVRRTVATTEIRLSLVGAAGAPWLRGIVLDASGNPAARVQLQVERGPGVNPGGSGERRPGSLEHFEKRVLQPGLLTSADGTFAVRLPYAGSWKVTARSGMLEKSASLTLGPGEEGFCRLELGRLSCRIFGSVVDEKGAPVAASVYARWEGGFLGSTARDGRFELWVNPRPGPCRVQAEHQGRRSAEVSVALGSPAEDHDLGTLVLRPE